MPRGLVSADAAMGPRRVQLDVRRMRFSGEFPADEEEIHLAEAVASATREAERGRQTASCVAYRVEAKLRHSLKYSRAVQLSFVERGALVGYNLDGKALDPVEKIARALDHFEIETLRINLDQVDRPADPREDLRQRHDSHLALLLDAMAPLTKRKPAGVALALAERGAAGIRGHVQPLPLTLKPKSISSGASVHRPHRYGKDESSCMVVAERLPRVASASRVACKATRVFVHKRFASDEKGSRQPRQELLVGSVAVGGTYLYYELLGSFRDRRERPVRGEPCHLHRHDQ